MLVTAAAISDNPSSLTDKVRSPTLSRGGWGPGGLYVYVGQHLSLTSSAVLNSISNKQWLETKS